VPTVWTLTSLAQAGASPITRGPLAGEVFISGSAPTVQSGTIIDAASTSSEHVQAAITSATTGDTVRLPLNGSATWSTGVTIPNTKGITLDGNGSTITHNVSGSQQPLITLSCHASVATRVTGFILLSGTFDRRMLNATSSASTAAFRLDHCRLAGSGNCVLVDVQGNGVGVIDHNDFEGGHACEMIHNLGVSGTTGWSDDITPGGSAMLFVEDNQFENTEVTGNPAYFYGASAIQSYYGARTVVRYNTMTMCQVDQHGTAGNIGARWWEIYNNTFVVVANGNQSDYMQLRAGSGVVCANVKSGATNSGDGNISLYEEDSGYPASYQIGRGKNQALDPAYVWGNAASMTVAPDGAMVQLNRDVYASEKTGWTAYTYPHPLQGA
jgi:hypothetical protein